MPHFQYNSPIDLPDARCSNTSILSQKDQFHLLYYFNKFLNKDKNNPKIIQFSEIGLVELTRARKGKNVYDVFTMKCYKCNSNGYLLKNLNFTNKKKYNLLALNTMSIQ